MNVTDDMSELTLEIVLRVDLRHATSSGCRSSSAAIRSTSSRRSTARNLQFAYKFRSARQARRRARRAAARETHEEHFDFLGMLMDARDKETGDADDASAS